MGCDIHLFAEYETPADGIVAVADGQFSIPRCYPLFSALAGVRNNRGLVPLFSPRGIPSNLSAGIFQHYFRPIVAAGDEAIWHGFPFIIEPDAKSGIDSGRFRFSSQQPSGSWVQSKLGYIEDTDAHTPSFLSLQEAIAALAHHSLALQDTPIQFQLLLSLLNEIEVKIADARTRIVFWFFS